MSETLSIYEEYILQDNISWLVKKVEHMNRRANRLKLPLMTLKIDREDTKNEKQESGLVFTYVKAALIGETPQLSGWHLVARIEHNNDPAFIGGNVIAVVPGQVLPKEYREAGPTCDHCKTNRFRNDTFVLQNGDGEYMRVGRQCLRDFLGHMSAAAMIEWSKYEKFAADMFGEAKENSSRVRYAWHLPTVIAMALAVTEIYGWCSRAKAQEEDRTATSSEVMYQLGNHNIPPELRVRPNENHTTMAEAVIEWGKGLGDTNDYEYNLGNVARSGVVPDSLFGTTVSMVIAYKKALDMLEKKRSRKASEYVGNPKDKITVKLRFANCWYVENQFGTAAILKFYDEKDNIFIWKTGSMGDGDFDKETWYSVKGTIKEHGEFRDEKQTIMTRCKVTPTEEKVCTQ